jgi:(1->4)-alpha-D-glucan 1-alpha-D-glucosylmutase
MPADWAQAIALWRTMNAPLIDAAAPSRTPSAAHEYMLYQALLGAWMPGRPDRSLIERMQAFAIKAAREGKEATSWLDPNEPYESGLKQFIHDILDRARSQDFIGSFGAFAARVALMGTLNSLAQVTLKATMPGVPDFYQGTELWDLSLVDPDNRRPVDFPARERTLRSLSENADWGTLAQAWPDGAIKLALTARLLSLRRRLPHVFTDGDYRPLEVKGPHRDELVAYARSHGNDAVIVIVARRFNRATQGGRRWPTHSDWDASVPVGDYSALQQILIAHSPAAGPELTVVEAFNMLPVAVLRARETRRSN